MKAINIFVVLAIAAMLFPHLAKAGPLEEQKMWLSGKIYGNDNDMAALRRVEITRDNGVYYAYILNQFSFKCELTFHKATGLPETLKNCKAVLPENKDWFSKTDVIPLKCVTLKSEIVCRGKYVLCSSNEGPEWCDKSVMTIARRGNHGDAH
jgi:hypothetical protein